MSEIKKIKLRKKEQVKEIIDERIKRSKDKEEKNKETWHKHWENENSDNIPRKLGGSKRPKPFNFNEEDDAAKREQEAKAREEKQLLRESRDNKGKGKL